MSLPKTVRIGGHDYEVRETDKNRELGGSGGMGFWQESESFIGIKKTMKESQKEETLLHEIVEIILTSTLEVDDKAIPHSLIQSLSSILYQSLKDSGLLVFKSKQDKIDHIIDRRNLLADEQKS